MKCGKCYAEMVPAPPGHPYPQACPIEGCGNYPKAFKNGVILDRQDSSPVEEGHHGTGYPVSPDEGDTEARHSILSEMYSDGDDDFDRSEDGPWRGRHH